MCEEGEKRVVFDVYGVGITVIFDVPPVCCRYTLVSFPIYSKRVAYRVFLEMVHYLESVFLYQKQLFEPFATDTEFRCKIGQISWQKCVKRLWFL